MVRNDLSYDANSGQLILTIFADPLQLFVSAQHFDDFDEN